MLGVCLICRESDRNGASLSLCSAAEGASGDVASGSFGSIMGASITGLSTCPMATSHRTDHSCADGKISTISTGHCAGTNSTGPSGDGEGIISTGHDTDPSACVNCTDDAGNSVSAKAAADTGLNEKDMKACDTGDDAVEKFEAQELSRRIVDVCSAVDVMEDTICVVTKVSLCKPILDISAHGISRCLGLE